MRKSNALFPSEPNQTREEECVLGPILVEQKQTAKTSSWQFTLLFSQKLEYFLFYPCSLQFYYKLYYWSTASVHNSNQGKKPGRSLIYHFSLEVTTILHILLFCAYSWYFTKDIVCGIISFMTKMTNWYYLHNLIILHYSVHYRISRHIIYYFCGLNDQGINSIMAFLESQTFLN